MSLPVSRLIPVSINLAPTGATTRSFGVLMVVGDTNVISGSQRYRTYTDLDSVSADLGSTAPETKAATLFFSQSPQPAEIQIGRWISSATSAQNDGAILSLNQQAIASFQAITNGGFTVTIDGTVKHITGLDFSGAANLNAVAADIQTALTGATCVWNGTQFVISSATTGTSSSVGFLTAPTSGQDISTLLGMTSSLGTLVQGYAAETPLAAITALADATSDWYGAMFASTNTVADSDHLNIAAFIQAQSVSRVYGITIQNTNVLNPQVTTDLASLAMAAGFTRTVTQYSSSSPYAIASFFGRAFSVDFTANNSTINLMYKQEPGVTFETLTSSQANALETKRCNVFVEYDNSTAIIQYGTMAGPAYFDEIQGLDWFQNEAQTSMYNLLYTNVTKVPQTDQGSNMLVAAMSQACMAGINNGLFAPGTWTGPSFGSLLTGQFLNTGYYIYMPSLSTQSQSDRDARSSPTMTVAVKLAGAFNKAAAIINVNR